MARTKQKRTQSVPPPSVGSRSLRVGKSPAAIQKLKQNRGSASFGRSDLLTRAANVAAGKLGDVRGPKSKPAGMGYTNEAGNLFRLNFLNRRGIETKLNKKYQRGEATVKRGLRKQLKVFKSRKNIDIGKLTNYYASSRAPRTFLSNYTAFPNYGESWVPGAKYKVIPRRYGSLQSAGLFNRYFGNERGLAKIKPKKRWDSYQTKGGRSVYFIRKRLGPNLFLTKSAANPFRPIQYMYGTDKYRSRFGKYPRDYWEQIKQIRNDPTAIRQSLLAQIQRRKEQPRETREQKRLKKVLESLPPPVVEVPVLPPEAPPMLETEPEVVMEENELIRNRKPKRKIGLEPPRASSTLLKQIKEKRGRIRRRRSDRQ